MALDHALIALPLGNPGNVHVGYPFKELRGDRLRLQLGGQSSTSICQAFAVNRHARLLEATSRRLAHPAFLLGKETQLNRLVPVGLGRLALQHDTRPGLDDRDRHMLADVVHPGSCPNFLPINPCMVVLKS